MLVAVAVTEHSPAGLAQVQDVEDLWSFREQSPSAEVADLTHGFATPRL